MLMNLSPTSTEEYMKIFVTQRDIKFFACHFCWRKWK